ncbi:MAG: right-handed parallel beta-helix repeat-containing protein [Nannocystaceae bacterium]
MPTLSVLSPVLSLALSPLLLACPNSSPETTDATDTSSETTTGTTAAETETGALNECPQSLPLTNAEFVGGLVLPARTCWTVDENLALSDGVVTIEEGVEIRFASNIKVAISSGGQLTIAGTADEPVVLGTADPLITWQGVSLVDSQGSANDWAHVIVENAGSAQWNGANDSFAALWLDGSTTLSLSAVTFQKNVGRALRATKDVALVAADLRFLGNAGTAWVSMGGAAAFGPETVLDGNDDDRIHVGFGNTETLSDAATWAALSAPYFITDRAAIEAPLTLDPGVWIQVEEGASLTVKNDGALTAEGTAESPIVFEGASVGTRGYWQGLAFEVGGTEEPLAYGVVLDHVRVADAGADAWNGNSDTVAAIFMSGSGSARITNTEIHNSAGYGLWVGGDARIAGFAGNHLHDNNVPMRIHPDRVGELAGTSTIENNTDDRVWVVFGNNDKVTRAATWRDLGTPYYIADRMYIDAAVEVEAGVEIEHAQDIGMRVTKLGSLTASGTADAPVVFRGANANASGFWRGLYFESNVGANLLTNVEVLDAGSTPWNGDPDSSASLFVTGGGALELVDAVVGPGGGFGAWVAAESSLTCTGTTDFPGTMGTYAAANDSVILGCI